MAGMTSAGAAGLMGSAELHECAEAAWFTLPRPAPFDLGFDIQLMPAFMASGIAAALRAVGVSTTCQRINDASWQRPDPRSIRGGVLADGLSNVLGDALGVTGMSIGPSLVGVSAAVGATSRVIGLAATLVLVVFAFSPKRSGFFCWCRQRWPVLCWSLPLPS